MAWRPRARVGIKIESRQAAVHRSGRLPTGLGNMASRPDTLLVLKHTFLVVDLFYQAQHRWLGGKHGWVIRSAYDSNDEALGLYR
jgi:hypothetical protein